MDLNARRSAVPAVVASLVLTALVAAVPAAQARAAYPRARDPYVNDLAGLLSSTEVTAIRDLFAGLEGRRGIEATLLTIGSIHDYRTGDTSIESFATGLFNTWGIGDRERDDGVLVLVAVTDRKVRIELGSGYGSGTDPRMKRVIDQVILPRFRRGDYPGGIAQGAAAVVRVLDGDAAGGTVPRARGPEDPDGGVEAPEGRALSRRSGYASPAQDRRASGSSSRLPLWGGLALLGGAAIGVPSYLRRRARRCPNCAAAMHRLDEAADDAHLDPGQRAEEAMRSVDHDVWQCPSCNWHELKSYRRWFSRTRNCPGCDYRTLRVRSFTVSRPTYSSTGRKRIDRTCSYCDYSDSDIVILPMLTRRESSSGSSSRSRSSGRSSFGGGRSSGGGAGGSW